MPTSSTYTGGSSTNWYYTWISDQMAASRSYAQDIYDTVDDYIGDLSEFVTGTLAFSVTTTPPEITIDQPGSIVVDTSLAAQLPAAPTADEYPTAPGDAPGMSDYAFPGSLSYSLPSVPVIHDIAIPSFVPESIPGITTTLPVFSDEVPALGVIDSGGEAAQDSLMQAIKEKLEGNIRDGGTMLNPSIEADLWNRDLERRDQALRDAIDKVTEQWAKFGWSLPDGLLAGQIGLLNTEYLNKNLESSRTIAIEQAKMEHDGMFKSIELGIGVEKALLDSANDASRRAIEAAKATAEVTISLFKERCNRYNLMVAAYKSEVEAYKTRIDAEVSKAQVYETQIKALSLINQIDETSVKVYKEQIAAINVMAEIYKNQVQAVGLQYEAEKTKIEVFKAKVESYTIQVDAITKKYAAQVEGFKAFVAGYSASADSQTKISELNGRAQIAEAEALIKEWEIQSDVITKNLTLRLEAVKALANVSSNIAAGAMAANHAGMNASISGTASLSY